MSTPEEKYNRAVALHGARLEVLPLYDAVVPGFVNRIPLLFQFVSGTDPEPQREPFSLAVVMDVSGSMQGAKLASCKTAILQLIDAADDEDRLTLVTYSGSVEAKFECVRCGEDGARTSMKAIVRDLTVESGTNLYGGLKEGYRILQEAKREGVVEVTLEKTDGVETLGIATVSACDGQSLRVSAVHDGFVGTWNTQHPDEALLEGDIILKCNGISGDGQKIRAAMKMSNTLRLSVLRKSALDLPNKHLFLLSDGQVNAGPLQKAEDILKAVAEWEEQIPILSYGIGSDFNEHLMSPLGQVHRGSHYFYITDAASIERLIAKGVRALTCAVARNVRLDLTPLSPGLFFPDQVIDGVKFPLVRERSVMQYLVEVEARPEVPAPAPSTAMGFEVLPADTSEPLSRRMSFEWLVTGFPLLESSRGRVEFRMTTDRGFRQSQNAEVRTYLDVKQGCELRKSAGGSEEARKLCEQALKLFQGRTEHDRFGFAQEWANKTQTLLDDASLWRGAEASGVAAVYEIEEEEEEEMDWDLFE